MVVNVKNANMVYQRKNNKCLTCNKILRKRYKYCSNDCMPIYHRKDLKDYVKPYKGQCKEKVRGYTGVHKCPNQGLIHRDGKCEECYLWMLKRLGIYPHKDNDTSCIEVYLVL